MPSTTHIAHTATFVCDLFYMFVSNWYVFYGFFSHYAMFGMFIVGRLSEIQRVWYGVPQGSVLRQSALHHFIPLELAV